MFLPSPFSPVHRHRKFSTVLGHTSLKSSNTILPAGYLCHQEESKGSEYLKDNACLLGTPLIVISKKHLGSGMVLQF